MIDNLGIIRQIGEMTDQAKNYGELQEVLNTMAHAIGGMVCHFEQPDRTQVLIGMTEAMGTGLMFTSKAMGEKCDLEMVVGKGDEAK
ncbi:hypothetical protein [Paenibacillus massiliensis]|uniref:hypothetical protein n=1 Tax=Paenibacillus massiliensis TaxID=225917 RepID=UPI0004127359|nr:hypothetical protein [Paenibacillus massiliensis]